MNSLNDMTASDANNELDDGQLIVPMDTGSIQRIVAGQAVTDLASAVKELVDNALDAGAKTINIRLFNQGIDVVEVSDDGSGVPWSSRPYMARKHATSKIRTFDDIYDNHSSTRCTTLGFRGEALFCLANLSENLVVVTRTRHDPLGQKMEYQRDGELRPDSVTMVPRKIGTTVAVGKLFHALPVRRADLIKRIKAQRAKVVSMVQGYGILCLGVRFNLIDVVRKGNGYREEIKLSTTNASTKVEQTCSSILGSRFVSGMTRISVDLTEAVDNKKDNDNAMWEVQGLVSKAPSLTARDGSVARESQFFSINGRPVELPKVSRAIGDAWRAFEGTKKRPACILCFTLPNSEYDVNLSPDKREVLLTNQPAICSLIHEAVTKLWSSQGDGNFKQNAVHVREQQQLATATTTTQPTGNGQPVPATATASFPAEATSLELSPGTRRRFQRRNAFVHDPSIALTHHEGAPQRAQHFHQPGNLSPPSGHTAASPVSAEAEKTSLPRGESDLNSSRAQSQSISGAATASTVPTATTNEDVVAEQSAQGSVDASPAFGEMERPNEEERRQWASAKSRFNGSSHHRQEDEIQLVMTKPDANASEPITPEEPPIVQEDVSPKRRASTSAATPDNDALMKRARTLTLEDFAFRPANKVATNKQRAVAEERGSATTTRKPIASNISDIDSRKRLAAPSGASRKRQKASQVDTHDSEVDDEEEETPAEEPKKPVVWNSFQGTDAVMKATQEARFSMRQFRKELRAISESPRDSIEVGTTVGGVDDACSEEQEDTAILHTDQSDDVVSLSKEDFLDMTVIGQFNMGFILCKCRKSHLWILDQHACDEKYNFERLIETTVMQEQKLLAPMPLELTPMEESCILENMDVFEENGFRFAHDPNKPPRHQLSLTSLPHSGAQDGRKAVQFGKDDVHALCAMLSSEEGYSQDGGTGADGSGMYGNNAVRRHAGVSQTQDTASKVIARLPKAIAMFANRACRGSIMIGTALSQKEMEAVVKRLASVESPWNCPHGRPTMRHVKDLMGIMTSDEQRAASLIAGPTMAVMTQTANSQEEEEG